MNARLLTPLIQEYVQNAHIQQADIDFLIQTGQELEVSRQVVVALVALEKERQTPTAGEPAALVYELIAALANQGKVDPSQYDLIKELGAGVRTSAAAVQALITAYQARQLGNTVANLRTITALARGLFRGQGFPQATIDFLLQRAIALKIPEQLATAVIQTELLVLVPGAVSSIAVYDGLLQQAFVANLWKPADRDFYLEKGQDLKIPQDVAAALLEIPENISTNAKLFGADALAPLLKAYARNGVSEEADLNVLFGKAAQLNVPKDLAAQLLQFEHAMQTANAPEAEKILAKVMERIKQDKQNPTVSESTFLTKKMMEVTALQKQAQVLANLGKNLRHTESKPAPPTTPPPVPEKPTAAIRPAVLQPAGNRGQRNLEEVYLGTLPDGFPVVRKAKLYNLEGGINWFVQLGRGNVNDMDGLLMCNGTQLDVKSVGELTFSNDGSHLAYILKKNNQQHIVWDGKTSEGFDAVGELTFSADGNAFACIVKKGKGYHVWQNGNLGRAYPAVRDLVFNPATNRLAYALVDDKKWHVFYNGTMDPAYGASGGLQFSPDGSIFSYWAKGGTKAFVVMNSLIGPNFEGVGDMVFSANSKQLAYSVNVPGGKVAVFWGGKTGPVFDRVRKIRFSPDGTQLLYLGTKDGREYLVTNHQPGSAFDELDSILYSDSGRTLAYVVTTNREKKVVTNGTLGRSYVEVSRLCFRPGTEQLVYKAYRDKQWMVVLDGEESEGFTDIDELVFSPNGAAFGYIGKLRNQWTGAIINGQRKAEAHSPKHLVFDDEGSRYAYMSYTKDGCILYINDRPAHPKPYTDLLQPPQYDAERKAFYFFARQHNNFVLVFVS